jgi:Mg-chelatase subunit ChlD
VVDREDDPVETILAAVNAGGPSDCVAGVVGALVGARHGADVFPSAWRSEVEHRDRFERRARRLATIQQLPAGRRVATKRPAPKTRSPEAGDEPVHIWFLIDRSGSMDHLRQAVVDGFNGFVTEQKSVEGKARLTLVQFDSEDPYEVLVDAARLEKVAPLTSHRYQPRGMTPLYDAMGSLIDAAEARIADRGRRGRPAEDQLVVVFTDGMENASQSWDRQELFTRIEAKKADGWTFVYLGANQDSYAAGGDLGVAQGSVSNWSPTPHGYLAASASVSRAAAGYRRKGRRERLADVEDFFDGVKEAETPR